MMLARCLFPILKSVSTVVVSREDMERDNYQRQ